MRAKNVACSQVYSVFWDADTKVAGEGWARRSIHEMLGFTRRWHIVLWWRVQ